MICRGEKPSDETWDARVHTRMEPSASSAAAEADELAPLGVALDAVQDALDALETSDALRGHFVPLLRTVTAAVQVERVQRGERPLLGCKRRDMVVRVKDNALKPLRAAAFDAMQNLLELVWRPMTSTERTKKLRMDPEKRSEETEAEVWRQQFERLEVEIREQTQELERRKRDQEQRPERERQYREQRDREAHAKEWSGVTGVLFRCGLGRLGSNATLDSLRGAGILPFSLRAAVGTRASAGLSRPPRRTRH